MDARRSSPRRLKRRPRTRTFVAPPNEACWIETDSYDRGAFSRLRDESPALADVLESGERLVPRFAPLVEDLFALCFKNNVVFRAPDAVAPSAHPHRPLLAALAESSAVRALREHTPLDEARAGLGAALLADELLAQIRSGRLWNRGDLRDLWDLAAEEAETRQKIESYAGAQELAAQDQRAEAATPGDQADDKGDRLARTIADLEHEAAVAEATLRQKARRIAERSRTLPADGVRRMEAEAIVAARQLETSSEDDAGWGLGLGSGQPRSAGQQVELGRRLARNPKLRRLAQMVGRMRESAFRLRKTLLERSNEETYAVGCGNVLSRVLPHELAALRQPIRRRDFQRRLIERQLQVYDLRGAEEKGRGPMVVCLDGSASMAGDKELWSKAVTLTLLDIARRQRRLFRFLCFSSADQPLWTMDLNPQKHYEIDERRVYDLAEYFPGGGTDFEKPLDAAVDCLRKARYRRGDIVFITDGECRVAPDWLAAFREEKERLGFFVFSVLIDVGSSTRDTVREFSDRVTSVRQLSEEGVRDLFLAV
jgi:uncharacterized protein with von Willebrand factor type A (vWA) domain